MEKPYDDLIKAQVGHFVNYCLTAGGILRYIPFNTHDGMWPGFCNPCIFWDEKDGDFKMVLRNVNHLMSNSGKVWALEHRLLYSNPQEDNRNLKTKNYVGRCKQPMYDDFEFVPITTKPYIPIWEFQGQEDGRMVRWEGRLLTTGVRRDNNKEGRGRMEIMLLNEEGQGYEQAKTWQIQGPNNNGTYCEKNWMPVQDMPWHYVRTTNPTVVCKTSPTGKMVDVISKPHTNTAPELDKFNMIRGSSPVIPWGTDRYIALVHTCEMWWTGNGRKVARYLHAFVVWDRDFNMVQVSPTFSFAGFDVEFSCGLEFHDGMFYIPFAINDNVPFLLCVGEKILRAFIGGDPLVEHTDKIPFHFYPDDCRMLEPGVGYDALHFAALQAYRNKELAKAYAMFMQCVEREEEFGHEKVYDDLFMAARCVADLGHRDGHEQSMWYHTVEWDPKRPEGYLALAMFYSYRWQHTPATYWYKKAVALAQDWKGPVVFYNLEQELAVARERCLKESKEWTAVLNKENKRAF